LIWVTTRSKIKAYYIADDERSDGSNSGFRDVYWEGLARPI